MTKRNSAFSLIELSIVILVIGILVAGITQGSSLYRKFKIQTAQSLTRSSPVNGIKDLAIWYEITQDQSLMNSSNSRNVADKDPISTIYDSNPALNPKNNATASGTSRPLFREGVINGLPALYFDGINDAMWFRNTIGFDMSFFAVIATSSSKTDMAIIAADRPGSVDDMNPMVIRNAGKIRHFYGDTNLTTECVFESTTSVNNGAPHIITTIRSILSPGYAKTYIDGKLEKNDPSDCTGPANKTSAVWIGNGLNNWYYEGYIAEIIIFERALTSEETDSVNEYLSKKYNISMS